VGNAKADPFNASLEYVTSRLFWVRIAPKSIPLASHSTTKRWEKSERHRTGGVVNASLSCLNALYAASVQ